MDAAKKKKGFLKPSTRENFCIYWYNFRSNKLSMVGLAIVVISLIFAIFAPYVAPFPEHAGAYVDLANAGVAPNATFWFGTDVTGRDILSRVIFGFRGALKMAVVVLAISVPVGTFLGLLAGYYHHTWVDTVIMRIMDMMLAIPSILLAIAIMAALGPGIEKAVVAIGLVSIPEYARIVRSEILSIKENDYVAAARVVGDSNAAIIFRHVLPNVLPSIIVRATLGISTAILDAAALGFLGLGVQPPAAEWGDMLGRGRNELFRAPWLMIFPGLAITLTVLAFNLLGDGIRDGLDPKARKR